MRLLQLKIKNIASLKGEHEIDFQSISNMSPLFAITGETGAGKSSILNSIGLVLYGKVYKSGVTQQDLVTLGEKEGQIELVFEVKGKKYYALWRVKVRKQNGEPYSTPQTPQRELYSLSEDGQKTILLTRCEELLNLDFDQFCKCIILNQGEFARFLSSSFTERKEILEKLYPGEMLESIGRELKTELDTLQKQKNDLDIELSALRGDGPQGEDLIREKEQLQSGHRLHENWYKVLEGLDYHFISFQSYHQKYQETQGKIESIKQGLTKETSVFNDLLKESQGLSESLLSSQKEQEKELPRLQELLKSEEAMKHLAFQVSDLQKDQTKYQTQSNDVQAKLNTVSEKLSSWEKEAQAHTQAFILPLKNLLAHHPAFDQLFEIYNQLSLTLSELKNKEERLKELEIQGKEENLSLKEIVEKKAGHEDQKSILAELEERKKNLIHETELKNRALIKFQELTQELEKLKNEVKTIQDTHLQVQNDLKQSREDLLPLETTLKLQGLLSAVEICLTHPQTNETGKCPVCESEIKEVRLLELKQNLAQTDLSRIKEKVSELSRFIIKKEEEELNLVRRLEDIKKNTIDKSHILKEQELVSQKELPPLSQLEEEIQILQKKVWNFDKLTQDEAKLKATLTKTREQYLILKKDISTRNDLKDQLQEKLLTLTAPMPELIEVISPESIDLLKSEARKLKTYMEHETSGEKLKQEKLYLEDIKQKAQEELARATQNLEVYTKQMDKISTLLEQELKGKKASELIQEIHHRVKEKTDALNLKERELKTQELKLKEFQSRLYTLDELIRDIDLQFTKEKHSLKEASEVKLPSLSSELTTLMRGLSSLGLELTSPTELFVPLKELIESQRDLLKDKVSELNKGLGIVSGRLADWEKRQDRITLLELKLNDLSLLLGRKGRLFEVLGRDELRTFVLSLVEEGLIHQTNDELQKLCQGRYEIVHQSRRMKLTPEFYIMDKFREGSLRKVSTLSGGETFMVSLAMALGLAEMTRGKAEIDSLFIDEGFGTLDQESLEDVLDMLKQIQTRGLMVGIISHVKALTSALPVNLLVSKKQDGTSSVSIQHN